jgi:putative DNA primase/helicase
MIQGTAREILGEVEFEENDGGESQDDLGRMLIDTLTYHGGKMATKQLMAEVRDAGHSWDAAKRIKKSLGIESEKDGMAGPWIWRLYGPSDRREHEGSEERRKNNALPSHSSALPSADSFREEPEDVTANDVVSSASPAGDDGADEVEVKL